MKEVARFVIRSHNFANLLKSVREIADPFRLVITPHELSTLEVDMMNAAIIKTSTTGFLVDPILDEIDLDEIEGESYTIGIDTEKVLPFLKPVAAAKKSVDLFVHIYEKETVFAADEKKGTAERKLKQTFLEPR